MKLLKKLKKSKVGRLVANVAIGALNSNPITSILTPSVKDFNEKIDKVDLDGDGKVADKQVNGSLVTYYALSYLGLGVTLFMIIWGLKNALSQEVIEWAINLLLKSLP